MLKQLLIIVVIFICSDKMENAKEKLILPTVQEN